MDSDHTWIYPDWHSDPGAGFAEIGQPGSGTFIRGAREGQLHCTGLSLENIQGQIESLADYRDNVVLVNNWATWCPPCKAEMPTLAAYYKEHATDGFTVIAIEAGDPASGVLEFAKSYSLEFPVWRDPGGASLRAFGNSTLPNSYVIDRSGTVRYAWTGEISKAMLEKYITPLLSEN